jgi:DNA adenine methylase
LARNTPEKYGTYFEPFLGGGAFLLSLDPEHARVNDFNPELVLAWKMVKDDPKGLIRLLKQHQANNDKNYYLDIRSMDRDDRLQDMSDLERAARFIYMNKTGFNGLWRVNSKGQNNVPFGSYKNPTIANESTIEAVSKFLNDHQVEFSTGDFSSAVADADTGDFVYFDPPYFPASATSSFTSYAGEFGMSEQIALRDEFVRLKEKGVFVLLSNSDVPVMYELYGEVATIQKVSVRRSIAAQSKDRKTVGEVLVRSW